MTLPSFDRPYRDEAKARMIRARMPFFSIYSHFRPIIREVSSEKVPSLDLIKKLIVKYEL
jgi:hypothetical protein